MASRFFLPRGLEDIGGAINQGDDSRVGSARDNSTGGTLSKIGVPGAPSKSASLASLLSTLVPVSIYALVCLAIFWILRHRCPRVYSPRAILARFLPQERSVALPATWFSWVKPFFSLEDVTILHHAGLDAYLFLRYLKVLALISFVGCLLTWPVLIPIHKLGGGGLTELDALTIGNVSNPRLYYVHVGIAYCYFGFILFTIYRECIFYINLRHAYLMSPYHAKRLSSRTVLFANVPSRYLDEHRIRKLFGDTVKNVWIPRDTGDLERLVKERDQTARRLEKAEIRLIKLANRLRRKQMEEASGLDADESSSRLPPPLPLTVSSSPTTSATVEDVEKGEGKGPVGVSSNVTAQSLPDVNGSVAAQWVPAEKRPHHRPIANYLRRVDTIKWTRNRLKVLRPQIRKLKRSLIKGDGVPLGAVFTEFTNQADAERAYQTVTHHRSFHMSPRFIGVRPDEIVWSSLRLGWGQRIVRRFLILALVTFAIIFWSIPSAIIGTVSNVQSIAKFVPVLFWLPKLPGPLLGIIQGLLPAVALTLLMNIVPWMLRGCGHLMGIPSLSMIELFVQGAYFAFQVVQVFLVTTLTSAASSSIMEVIQDPLSAKDLLSKNLPKASNFYISYILVQCMAVGATALVHVLDLIRHHVMAKSMASPRLMFNIWNRVRTVHWGGKFPRFTNMGVIAISYSCIAPLILVFSAVGMMVIYVVYRYNLLFIYNTTIDTRGLVYPKALLQLLMGLYLSQICMIGLFAIQLPQAMGPLVLMVAFFIVSILVHLSLDDAISPLLYNLPRTLAVESEELAAGASSFGIGKDDSIADGAGGAGTQQPNPTPPIDDDSSSSDQEEDNGPEHITTGTRAVEGADTFASTLFNFSKGTLSKRIKDKADAIGLHHIYRPFVRCVNPDPSVQPNFALRWLHPGIFDDFARLQATMLPPEALMPDPVTSYPPDYATRAYWPPVMSTPLSKLWIPRDEAGVSTQEVAHSSQVIEITDEGAWLDDKGKVTAEMDKAPFWEPRVLY